MRLRFKNIDYDFLIGNGEVYNIKIENPHYLYSFIKDIKDMNGDAIFLYDGDLLDLNKYIVYLENILQLDINSKKQITSLYNQIEKNEINDNYRQQLSDINTLIIKLINEITLNSNIKLNYDDALDFKTLFSSINLKYYQDSQNFIDDFINFIKILKEISKVSVIITINLYDFLTLEDIQKLIEELKYLHLSIINIGNNKSGTTKNIIIDQDLCQLT